jgi:FlaG/FlaF family flagellin (archaellin)
MGIILLVAVTIVLAAVLGTYALGMTEEVSGPVPQASFETEIRQTSFGSADYNIVYLTHKYGDKIDGDNLRITVNGRQAWDVAGMDDGSGRTVKPTERVDTFTSGTQLRLVYWDNNYGNFPVPDGDLYVTMSAGTHVITASDVSDRALHDDMVKKGDTIRMIYESPKTGETIIIEKLTI